MESLCTKLLNRSCHYSCNRFLPLCCEDIHIYLQTCNSNTHFWGFIFQKEPIIYLSTSNGIGLQGVMTEVTESTQWKKIQARANFAKKSEYALR